ncbi:hypothetical protein OE88DRAFT_1310926 [Heliocybe sulcata]|uniref:Uncharacterized protein n=1 Tax=Heliocybe sulcata TaxID=5364 RepID=A0A5C3N8V7_9AGAM|nr:hypothetical protein OE88DRAFT_1310926 [Heliocybe sulcata]
MLFERYYLARHLRGPNERKVAPTVSMRNETMAMAYLPRLGLFHLLGTEYSIRHYTLAAGSSFQALPYERGQLCSNLEKSCSRAVIISSPHMLARSLTAMIRCRRAYHPLFLASYVGRNGASSLVPSRVQPVLTRCFSKVNVWRNQDQRSGQEASSSKATRWKQFRLRTLRAENLSSRDFTNLSGRTCVSGLTYHQKSQILPFPASSAGFFYWHREPGAPALAGQLRFRVTRSSDPADFRTGEDLRLPNGLTTWNVSAFALARYSRYQAINTLALSEGLVQKALPRIREPGRQCAIRKDSTAIWRFYETFVCSLHAKEVNLWVLGNSKAQRTRLQSLFLPPGLPCQTVYTGNVELQFEPSRLPEHKGTRTVVLRIVKVYGLSRREDYIGTPGPEPREGELVTRRVRGRADRIRVPWSLDIDKAGAHRAKMKAAFEILYENEEHRSR